ncbi:DUF4129 domain-containing protein [Isoptericola sp. BMS4]|uniref:DUF4129 domain-containing protein n=1 Tax=Isoptericola sp. BMS4 TaxID=2527875 RepID=UPI001423C709|nr:DUF4129 domain-containing protein [Isoptericola sp. BMS4]
MSARQPPPRRTPPRAPALTALVTLVVLGAATATPWRFALPDAPPPTPATPDAPRPAPSTAPLTDADPTDTTALTVLAVVLSVLGAALLLVLLTLLARRVLTATSGPEPDDDPDAPRTADTLAGTPTPTIPTTELADAVQLALAHVDAATTPHDAVVAAWVALEDAAATHGTTRDPADTPTEFTTHLLAGTPAPRTHVATLRTLYAEARFTDHPVPPTHVDRARDALRHIARALDDAPTDARDTP